MDANTRSGPGRALLALGAAGALVLAPACDLDEILSVENPDEIMEGELDDPEFVDIQVASAVGEFQNMYDDPLIWRGSMPTDEQVTGINWENTARLNERIVPFENAGDGNMFGNIQRALVMADTATSRLKEHVDDPATDPRVATTLSFGGMSHVLLAETMCEATIKVSEEIYEPDEVMEMAVPRFEEAIDIASAAGEPEVEYLARTGLARAHLWLGNEDQVMEAAGPVPEDFAYWANYSTASSREENTINARVEGNNHALGVHPRFLQGEWLDEDLEDSLTDPRVQHFDHPRTGHNALSPLYTPYAPRRYSTYTGEAQALGGEPGWIERNADIMIADGIEARHHYAEADGPTEATLEFVNERRQYGNQEPLEDPSDEELMEELREQRGRDLYLSGFRLGDLRRWKNQGVGDFFPTGTHPTEEWGEYSDATCFPLPRSEYEGNPHLEVP